LGICRMGDTSVRLRTYGNRKGTHSSPFLGHDISDDFAAIQISVEHMPLPLDCCL